MCWDFGFYIYLVKYISIILREMFETSTTFCGKLGLIYIFNHKNAFKQGIPIGSRTKLTNPLVFEYFGGIIA